MSGLDQEMKEYYRVHRWLAPSERDAEEAYQYLWDAVRNLIQRKRTERLMLIRPSILSGSQGPKGRVTAASRETPLDDRLPRSPRHERQKTPTSPKGRSKGKSGSKDRTSERNPSPGDNNRTYSPRHSPKGTPRGYTQDQREDNPRRTQEARRSRSPSYNFLRRPSPNHHNRNQDWETKGHNRDDK